MEKFNVDNTKCCRDGFCAGECPFGLLNMEDEGGFPNMKPELEPYCMECGHCVAVCPHNAVEISGIPKAGCLEVKKEMSLSPEQAEHFVRGRRSVRFFKEDKIDQQTILKLIELARYAPTAHNTETVQWTVITDKEKLYNLSAKSIDWMRNVLETSPSIPNANIFQAIINRWDMGKDPILRNGPVLVVASSPREDQNGLVDCTIALTTLELVAPTVGIGGFWAGLLNNALLNSSEILQYIGIPKGHTRFYPMILGPPKYQYHRMPERKTPMVFWQ